MDFCTKAACNIIQIHYICTQIRIIIDTYYNMRHFCTHILFISVLLAFTMESKADTEFQLTQYTTADGLANNTVRHIMQDTNGRLWICTSNGLSMYDGNSFVNYHPIRNSSEPCLSDQRTKNAFEKDGLLWIATTNSLSCLDLRNNKFIDYASKGIKVPENPDSRRDTRIIIDKQGRTWKVKDNDGLYIINNKTGETEHFTTTSKNNPLPTNALKCIYQDKNGTIWIGTDNLGISKIDVVNNDAVQFILEGENIRMLMPLGNDKIAVGNRSGNVWIYDASLKNRISSYHRDYNTYCVYKDHNGSVWEGTKGGGLYVDGEQMDNSPYTEIYSILEDKNREMWIGTFGAGLYHNGNLLLNGEYGSKRIRSLFEDKKGFIWAGTSNGVFVINDNDNLNHIVKHLSVESRDLFSNEIRTMFIDAKGNIYIAETGEGFAVIDGERFNKEGRIDIVHFTEQDSLVNTMVQSFVEDKQGFIWIATEFGISKFNPITKTLKNYFFSKNMLNNVYSENCGIALDNGNIAFGTNNGIIIIDPSIYNSGEKGTDIKAEDITVNGQTTKRGIIYVVSKWWKSPWAIGIYSILIIIALFYWRRVKQNTYRFNRTIKKLNIEKGRLEAEKEEIKEQYNTEVNIKREAERSAADEDFIKKIELIATNEMQNANFSADDFAEQMGIGRTLFFSKMKAITGYSPKEYMKLKRIKKAAEMISSTNMPIGEIGFQVGIDDPLYFSRVFKQVYGVSPTEWRKKSLIPHGIRD